MEPRPLFSIIVPTFQSENTIEKCISAICNNKAPLEIIVVDDGSTDNTRVVCERLAREDSRVTYVFQDNAGPGIARENGVAHSSGYYIGFSDADDFYVDGAIDFLAKYTEQSWDIVEFSYVNVLTDGTIINRTQLYGKEYFNEDCLSHFVKRENSSNSLCNKIFKREVIENIHHTKLFMGEDMLVSMEAYGKAQKSKTIEDSLYCVTECEGSRIRSSFSEKNMDDLVAYRRALNYLTEFHPKLREDAIVNLANHALYLYKHYIKTRTETNKDIERKLLETFYESAENIGLPELVRRNTAYMRPRIVTFYMAHINEYVRMRRQ